MLHDANLAEAILDRGLERGRVLHFKGPSFRARHLRWKEGARVSGTHNQLRREVTRSPRKVVVISDDAGYHHSHLRKDWSSEVVDEFELSFPPSQVFNSTLSRGCRRSPGDSASTIGTSPDSRMYPRRSSQSSKTGGEASRPREGYAQLLRTRCLD